jgi:protein TonB
MAPSDTRRFVAGALAVSSALHAAAFLLLPAGRAPIAPRPQDLLVEVEIVEAPPAAPEPPAVAPAPPIQPVRQDATPHAPPPVRAHEPTAALAAAAPAMIAGDDTPSFTIAIGTGDEGAHGAVTAAAPPLRTADAPRTFEESDVDQLARLVRGVAPSYPEAARAAGVEGNVRFEIVVDAAGGVESARVVRGTGGLDEAALAAIHKFRFAPATKGGQPVRVRMRWSIQFQLQ